MILVFDIKQKICDYTIKDQSQEKMSIVRGNLVEDSSYKKKSLLYEQSVDRPH